MEKPISSLSELYWSPAKLPPKLTDCQKLSTQDCSAHSTVNREKLKSGVPRYEMIDGQSYLQKAIDYNIHMVARIQFSLAGSPEEVIPDIRITRSKDGTNGTATFLFQNPVALDGDNMEEIAGLYLIDEEGELVSRDVNGKFVNGQADAIEATYIFRTVEQWNRFMRFMERYAEANGLDFTKGAKADSVASPEAAIANEANQSTAPVAEKEGAGFQLALLGFGLIAVLLVVLYFVAQAGSSAT